MEVYLSDLRAWPLEVALKALDRWPDRSQWWPTWRELVELIGEIQADRIALLPKPAPEHRPFEKRAQHDMFEPFSRTDWFDFQDAMRKLRDPNVPMLARESLLRIGEKIEARQLPHAKSNGWA